MRDIRIIEDDDTTCFCFFNFGNRSQKTKKKSSPARKIMLFLALCRLQSFSKILLQLRHLPCPDPSPPKGD